MYEENLSERLEVRVTPTMKKIVKSYAEMDGTSMGEAVRAILRIGINLTEEEKKTVAELEKRKNSLEKELEKVNKTLEQLKKKN